MIIIGYTTKTGGETKVSSHNSMQDAITALEALKVTEASNDSIHDFFYASGDDSYYVIIGTVDRA